MIESLVLAILFGVPFLISLAWVWSDANRRGMPGWLVAVIIGFAMWPLSLVVWLLIRPKMFFQTRRQKPNYSQYDW